MEIIILLTEKNIQNLHFILMGKMMNEKFHSDDIFYEKYIFL